VIGDTIFDLAAATARPTEATMLDVLRDWPAARALLADAAETLAALRLQNENIY
jgi:hypothetical protein